MTDKKRKVVTIITAITNDRVIVEKGNPMKKPEISFRVFGGSGPLSIYFYPGPYGDAIECKNGKGIYWLSQTGALLGVEFDDVAENSDHQILELPDGTKIEVDVKKGRVHIKTHFKVGRSPKYLQPESI